MYSGGVEGMCVLGVLRWMCAGVLRGMFVLGVLMGMCALGCRGDVCTGGVEVDVGGLRGCGSVEGDVCAGVLRGCVRWGC